MNQSKRIGVRKILKPKRTQAYWAKHKLEKCECGGYWFPHRKGGGACEHSSKKDFYAAMRAGLPLSECQTLLSVQDLEILFPIK